MDLTGTILLEGKQEFGPDTRLKLKLPPEIEVIRERFKCRDFIRDIRLFCSVYLDNIEVSITNWGSRSQYWIKLRIYGLKLLGKPTDSIQATLYDDGKVLVR